MRFFLFKIKHNNGIIRLITNGSDEEAARKSVCNAEGYPDNAILKCTEMYRNQKGRLITFKSEPAAPDKPVTFWLAIGNKPYWDDTLQTSHTVSNWAEATAIAYAVSKINNREVRLSLSKGYNNQGHYYWHFHNQLSTP